MTITFTGSSSVLDRAIFTDRGPIVKRPLPILVGANCQIISETDVFVISGNFTSFLVGYDFIITGTQGSRNNGKFRIQSVLSSTKLRLANVSFDISDAALTTNKVVALTNDLKDKFNRHRTQSGVHASNDTVNIVTAPLAVDLVSAIAMLNDIRTQLAAHVVMAVGIPPVHSALDIDDIPVAPPAHNLVSAVLLANDLAARYENHRTLNAIHATTDFVNRIMAPRAAVIKGTYPSPLTGPFTWTIENPRLGMIADDPSDVDVFVNSMPASVEAVFGLLGAVVLTVKPGPLDDVKINYDFLNNPPSKFSRLNSFEFNLNQIGNNGLSGFPGHKYRARSYLIDPAVGGPDLMSPVVPKRVGWKFKALERAYSAVLNDPTTLLLNVPTNKLVYPVLFLEVHETTIRYDPTSLPQNSIDPWTLEGDGSFSLLPGGTELTITDSVRQSGVTSRPPFFTHHFDIVAPSIVSAAFRACVTTWVADGAFTGVSFGVSDGDHVGLVGFLETNATSLSSAITRVNNIKAAFNSHLIQSGVHNPNDPADAEIFINAHDLPSLLILVNDLKAKYNAHLNKSALGGVHQVTDISNLITLDNAHDLNTAIQLVNVFATSFNSHRTQVGIHFIDDSANVVTLVRQVGFLTNRDVPEIETSWNAFSIDWTIPRTYRISRDPDGNISVYLSGEPAPSATALASELPSISDLDGRFDALQQVFFGSVEKEATSVSKWNFVRANANPLDSNFIGDNKYVSMIGLPELADPPWITIGQGGIERLVSSTLLLVDSTCSAPSGNIASLGQSSGAYRGYLRIEPIITSDTTVAYDISAQVDYYTFGVDNRSAGIFVDDDDFTVQLSFIQYSPSAATVTGSTTEPFALTNQDALIFSIADGPPITVNFAIGDTLSSVITAINTATGFAFADSDLNHLRLTSSNLGAEANFSIISGSAMVKLGLSPGIYFGRDSNPEPRVSWFGENIPDQDTPKWTSVGSQPVQLLSRSLRILDVDPTDYRVYNLSDFIITNNAFNASINWKLDVRIHVLSFANAVIIPASPPFLSLRFIGALVSVDEGATGKNVELQLAIDGSGNQYVNLLSFNIFTNSLDVKGQYAFAWNDGKIHSFNVYTNKSIDSIFVLADGVPLSPIISTPAPTYSGLNQGVFGPSISFGSGSSPVAGADLRTPSSIVDWHSVAIFKDSKVADPTAGQRRFIGLYKGGDPALLASYYLAQFDWSSLAEYRLVRDPQNSVSVFINNNPTPVISVSYDSLILPPVSSSFLREMTNNRSAIAFGSFNPQEISRSRWAYVKYSVGKITLTDRLIPRHQVLNQANVVVSSEHLTTNAPHGHFGFSVYSGGAPSDDFLAEPDVPAATILGEGTPPVPATQNLENRGGLKKTVTPFDDILTNDFVNIPGFTSNYVDDTFNALSQAAPSTADDCLAAAILLSNTIQPLYNSHIISAAHFIPDTFNSSPAPLATDLPTLIGLVNNIKAVFNFHIFQSGVHNPDDSANQIITPDAVDLLTLVDLLNDVIVHYERHRLSDGYHKVNDTVNNLTAPAAIDLRTLIANLEEIRAKFAPHALSTTFHKTPDFLNGNYSNSIAGVTYGQVQLDTDVSPTLIVASGPPAQIGDYYTFLFGPNVGIDFSVSRTSAGSFKAASSTPLTVTAGLLAMAKVPSTVMASDTATVDAFGILVSAFSITIHVGDVIQFISGPNAGIRQTVIKLASPTSALIGMPFHPDSTGSPFHVLRSVPGALAIGLDTAIGLGNRLKRYYDRHLTIASVHPTIDQQDDISSTPDAYDVASLTALVNSLHNAYNLHIVGQFVHVQLDNVDIIVGSPLVNPLTQAILVANDFKRKFNQHVVQNMVHVHDDTADIIIINDAVDLDSLMALLNAEKQTFNRHIGLTGVHVLNDTVNTVSAANAADLESALSLAIALRSAYESHRIQAGVHGSSVFIRLDPPSRVVYEGIKFFEFESGTAGLVSPFSDDETWHIDGVDFTHNQTLTIYNALPQQVQMQGDNVEPYSIIGGDTLVLSIDNGLPITVTFSNGDNTATLIAARINATPGVPAGFASVLTNIKQLAGNSVMLISPTVGSGSNIQILSGTASQKIGLDVCQPTPWFIVSDNPSNVSVNLVSIGPTNVTNYQTINSGTRTVFRNNSKLPDVVSLDWEIVVNIRINSVFSPGNVDSGIYVGVSGLADFGYSVGIGFDRINSIPFVTVQDLNANVTLYRTPFNWADGNFHTYKLLRDIAANTIGLTIVS